MGQTRSIIFGLALALSQAGAAYAADLGLPPPPEPCPGCSGPIYLKGFVGAANPEVDGIFFEQMQFNDFQILHKDIKSTTLFGLGVGYDAGRWFRFDSTGEYRGKSLFIAQDRFSG